MMNPTKMHTFKLRSAIPLATAIALVSAVPAISQEGRDSAAQSTFEVTLVSEEFHRHSARIIEVSPQRIVAAIDGAAERSTAADRWIGWTSPLDPESSSPSILLNDGQRFFGRPSGGDGDTIRWTAEGIGPIEIHLEQIDRIVLAPRLDPGATDGLDDVVVLTNGDRLRGFVVSLDDGVEIEVESRAVQIPLHRVAVIDLAGGAAARQGPYMWFASGSVARLEAADDVFLLAQAPSDWSAAAPVHEARAFVYDAARIVALGELPMTSHAPIGRRWAPPPQIDTEIAGLWAAPVNLPGPMRVSWALPEQSARFGAVVELREDSRVWGDCEVVVAQRRAGDVSEDGHELHRVRLTGEAPRAQLAFDLEGGPGAGELIISVEPGPSGPIQDRVRIDGALVLLGQ